MLEGCIDGLEAGLRVLLAVLAQEVVVLAAAGGGRGEVEDLAVVGFEDVAALGFGLDRVEAVHEVCAGVDVVVAAEDGVDVEPFGLEPGTEYFYRFRVTSGDHSGTESPVGRTKTAPSFNATPESLTFAVASCANWESGFFAAYRDMAERGPSGELDFVAFLGDYIYEYGTGEYHGKSGVARPHYPSWEIVTFEDYRMRYGRYRTDANLQAAHASAPWVVTWDDHESANDAFNAGAQNHTDGFAEGQWDWRYNQALQAYYEWMPLRRPKLS